MINFWIINEHLFDLFDGWKDPRLPLISPVGTDADIHLIPEGIGLELGVEIKNWIRRIKWGLSQQF